MNKYRGIPFWSWNCKVTKEQIDHDLDVFEQMGFGGVDIHPRVGLDNEYLGDEFMELVQYTVDQCKKRGMICWLYDDDRYPSGAADGIVTKEISYRMRDLLLTLVKKKTTKIGQENQYCADRACFELACQQGKKPSGYFVGAYALRFEDGILQEYHFLQENDLIDNAKQNGYVIRYAYVVLSQESTAFENQTYIDTLNADAVKKFIEVTHERYEQAVGEAFGRTIEAIFTDEPRIGKQTLIASAESEEDVHIPYSEAFNDWFEARYGNGTLLSTIPELIWNLPEGRHKKNRYQYRNALAECFSESYMDQICTWCNAHGILMTGHVFGETPLANQAASVGECMRNYRNMDIPGFDVLCDDLCIAEAKQAVSVARQMGCAGTVSELYGVTGWDCTFETYRRQGNWQAALGVTRFVPHLSFMSMAGEAKRDWPASISFQSPWYKEFSSIEDHFCRLNEALSHGHAVTRVAVLHPIESVWLNMGQINKNEEVLQQIQQSFDAVSEKLLFHTIDFDYLSEALLVQQCEELIASGECKEKGKLNVGKASYQTVIVPSVETLRSTTIRILKAFHDAGGRVLFVGQIPTRMDAVNATQPAQLAAECEIVEMDDLLEALKDERDVQVLDQYGQASNNLFYQLRADDTGKWLFLCPARFKKDDEKIYSIRVAGQFHAKQYNTQTGTFHDIPYVYTEKETCIFWHAYAQDELLLRLESVKETKQWQLKPDAIVQEEANALVLDYAEAVLDGKKVFDRKEILKLDDEIREYLGYELRHEHMLQPWATPKRESHELVLKYEFESELSTAAEFALELPDTCQISLNGKAADMTVQGYYVDSAISIIHLPDVKKGKNELLITLLFHQKTNLEAMYLLGTFGVFLQKTKAILTKQRPLMLGDITSQGLPFYTGNLRYEFTVQIHTEGVYSLCVPKWKAPVLTVFIDKKKIGTIICEPYTIDLGKLSAGNHTISICMYGNRNNAFGAIHNPNEYIRWNGPTAYRTTGADWTDEYRVKPVGIEEVYLFY